MSHPGGRKPELLSSTDINCDYEQAGSDAQEVFVTGYNSMVRAFMSLKLLRTANPRCMLDRVETSRREDDKLLVKLINCTNFPNEAAIIAECTRAGFEKSTREGVHYLAADFPVAVSASSRSGQGRCSTVGRTIVLALIALILVAVFKQLRFL